MPMETVINFQWRLALLFIQFVVFIQLVSIFGFRNELRGDGQIFARAVVEFDRVRTSGEPLNPRIHT